MVMKKSKMSKGINNYIILLACILIVIPFNIIIRASDYYINLLIYYIPSFIGYIILLTNYKLFDYKRKKLLKIMISITIISILAIFWYEALDYNDNWKTNTMSDLGAYIIPSLLFYGSYFAQRILGIILCIGLFKKNKG